MPSGGAGIQADLKTFHQFGVYGEAAITLITVQNTRGVQRVECLAPELVADQIRAVDRRYSAGRRENRSAGQSGDHRSGGGAGPRFFVPAGG